MKQKIWLLLLLCALLAGCGAPVESGWVENDKGVFYRDASGEYLRGWQEIDGNRYYFEETGAMVTGWLEQDGKRYHLDDSGIPQTGWTTLDGKTLLFDSEGAMVTGWTERDGIRCYLQGDGTPGSGWLEDGAMTYYLDDQGVPVTLWQKFGAHSYYFQENGCMLTGWAQFGGQLYYFAPNGPMQTGWAEIDGSRYFFNEEGHMLTGWQEVDGSLYYLQDNGAAATGQLEVDGAVYYFSSHGICLPLVNPWNSLPQGYETELAYIDGVQRIAAICYDPLMRMLNDCAAAGHPAEVVSAYRTMADQEFLYQRKVNYYLDLGYSLTRAREEAGTVVAVPGTSEHQLGLAADIVDVNYRSLDDFQANTAAQKWLMEHCHEYGFILRYPAGTTDITGIIYEPWHYRYVGIQAAREIHDLGITLEEYLNAVVTE